MKPCGVCGGSGRVIGGDGYGRMNLPPGCFIVQRCDACDQFSGDIAAAVDQVKMENLASDTPRLTPPFRAYAIAARELGEAGFEIVEEAKLTLYQAAQSDAWIARVGTIGCRAFVTDEIAWISERTAVAEGLYSPPHRDLGGDRGDLPPGAEPEITGAQAQAIVEVYAILPERSRTVLLGMPLSAAAAICGRLREGLKVLDAPADKE